MKRLLRKIITPQAGFALLDLLVVIAIIGALAGIAVPNAARFFESGKGEAYETELLNVKSAVMTMLRNSRTGQINAVGPTDSADDVFTTDTVPLVLSSYLERATSAGKFKSGCSYIFGVDGSVSQILP